MPHKTPSRGARLVIVALLIGAFVVLVPKGGKQAKPVPAPPAPRVVTAPDPLFAPDSVWNEPLSPKAPLDPASRTLVAALALEAQREQGEGTGPFIQTDSYSTPLYKVGPQVKPQRVRLDPPVDTYKATLQAAFQKVPIPAGAEPAQGTDAHMTVWQPSRDRLWEFFGARHASDGWHARYGGAIDHVSHSPGYYTSSSWPGARPEWGATASSLPVIAGTMLVEELRAGRIDHALALDLPHPRPRTFAWPAQRTDGNGTEGDIPEGAHLRLDPTLDIASLGLPAVVRTMARAAQRYGMIVRDKTDHAIGFYAEDPRGDEDPYRGPGGLLKGRVPTVLLARFPWSRLQVMPMSLCDRAPCPRPKSR